MAQQALELEVPETSAPRILIPVAGNTPGANGTYFRSDISIINFADKTQRVQLRWLPQASSGLDVAPVSVDIAAHSGIVSEDFVGAILGRTGLGAIEVVGVTGSDVFDPDATLHVTSRIWTLQPDLLQDGTNSQTLPSIILGGPSTNIRWAFGVRRSSQYRVNAGVTNLATVTQRFRFTAVVNGVPETPVEVDLPARSMQQVALNGSSSSGALQIIVQNLTATSAAWHAWASSIDNITGDAWSQMAFPAPAQ